MSTSIVDDSWQRYGHACDNNCIPRFGSGTLSSRVWHHNAYRAVSCGLLRVSGEHGPYHEALCTVHSVVSQYTKLRGKGHVCMPEGYCWHCPSALIDKMMQYFQPAPS